jgi:hypothetical protein
MNEPTRRHAPGGPLDRFFIVVDAIVPGLWRIEAGQEESRRKADHSLRAAVGHSFGSSRDYVARANPNRNNPKAAGTSVVGVGPHSRVRIERIAAPEWRMQPLSKIQGKIAGL